MRPTTLYFLQPFQIVPVIVLFMLQGLLLLWYSRAMAGLDVRLQTGDKVKFGILIGLPVVALASRRWLGDWNMDENGGLLSLPALIASVSYGLRARRTLKEHDAGIRDRYSNIEDVNLVWLRYATYGFVGVWCIRLLGFGMVFIGNFYFVEFFSAGANVPAMILIAWMVILGLGQNLDRATPADESQGNSPKPPNKELVTKLDDLMRRVKVYQDPDLDLDGLADSLGTSPRSLSGLINSHHKMNFYDFVNGYRVREAQECLEDPDKHEVTIQRIFEDAGFRTKSTFYTFFKKVNGLTPAEYRRTLKISASA
jgi:AraC-like DNA-binding protein